MVQTNLDDLREAVVHILQYHLLDPRYVHQSCSSYQRGAHNSL